MLVSSANKIGTDLPFINLSEKIRAKFDVLTMQP